MIQRPKESFLNKRWVYGISKLELEPFKYPDEESECYDKETPNVGKLEAPNLIVSEELEMSGKTTRRYAVFENYVQVYRLCENIRSNGATPHLYEICPYYMKIHFDIDLKLDSENASEVNEMFEGHNRYHYLLKPCLESIEEVFAGLFPLHYNPSEFIDNVLVFEAHRSSKISFHIVVDGFYLSCHETHSFYEKVKESMACKGCVSQASMVDFSVYKKNQAFRMFGSNKASMPSREGVKQVYNGPPLEIKTRTFSRERMYASSFRNETDRREGLRNLRILERSLLSHTLGNVRLSIPSSKPDKGNNPPTKGKGGLTTESRSISDEELTGCLNIFFGHPCSKTEKGEKAFSYTKYVSRGGYICLIRDKPSHCPVCKKDHEAENAFLYRTPTGDVNFVCRRAQESKKGGSSLYIGQLGALSTG
jgi:hypothetical protein